MSSFSVLTIFPLISALVGGLFAAILLNRYIGTRRRPHELAWGIAFLLFALGSACQVYADLAGWTPLVARMYYLAGAVLNVGFLGLGTLYLVAKRPVANVALLVMLALTAVSAVVLAIAPVDTGMLQQEAGWKAVAAVSPWPRVLAILINTLGTLLVVGGALWSAGVFWRRRIMKHRMIGVLLLAAGTMVVALGGTITGVTGLRNHDYLYLTMSLGAILMFVGYLQTIRPEPAPAQRLRPVEVQAARES